MVLDMASMLNIRQLFLDVSDENNDTITDDNDDQL